MNVAVLFSGGKDSNYALYWALNQGWDVSYLVSVVPARDDSFMYHVPAIELTGLQAECIGIPLIKEPVSGEKEREVEELEKILSKLDIDGIVSGAVESEYQKTRIDTICENLGFKSFSPLWHKKPITLLGDILSAGFEVMVVGVSAEGLDGTWLGKVLDEEALTDLSTLQKKFGVHPAGEGGEYETTVLDGSTYKKRIEVLASEKKWDKQSGTLGILKTRIVNKT